MVSVIILTLLFLYYMKFFKYIAQIFFINLTYEQRCIFKNIIIMGTLLVFDLVKIYKKKICRTFNDFRQFF